MRSVLEKQIVRRTNRLIRVRRLMCLLSIFCVLSLPTLFSDGYEGYESAILETFGRRYAAAQSGEEVARATPNCAGLKAYGQVIKSATGQSTDGIKLNVIRGKARLEQTLALLGYHKINTSVVERHNATSRLRNQRKVRRTLAFSKATRYHEWMSWVSVVQYNVCRAHGNVRVKEESGIRQRPPAMASRLTDHIWSTRDWLLSPVLVGQE